jgi:hypothetical protein
MIYINEFMEETIYLKDLKSKTPTYLRKFLECYKEYKSLLSEINKKIQAIVISKRGCKLKDIKVRVEYFDYLSYGSRFTTTDEPLYISREEPLIDIFEEIDDDMKKIYARAMYEEMKNIRQEYVDIIKDMESFMKSEEPLSEKVKEIIF